ncbi:MAG TPA: hypothetical protein VGE54_09805 [Brevundimonas sp.]
MPLEFYGPRLKLDRAKHHIDELETIFRRYVIDNMRRSRPKKKRDGREVPSRRLGSKLPEHVPTILGDAIHNLRVALDHGYTILVEANGGTPTDYTRFMFGKDRKSLKGSMEGAIADRIPDELITRLLDEIEPYEGGKLSLWELHRLDITDKHSVLLPAKRALHIDQLDITDQDGRPTGGRIKGISLVMDNPQASGAFVAVGGNMGLKLKGDPHSAFDILFGPGPLEDKSILSTLRSLHTNVSTALDVLQR